MKKIFSLVLVLSLGLIFCQGSSAQVPKVETQAAASNNQTPVKTIFDYKDELKLTEKQVTDLKKTISDLQAYIGEKKSRLEVLGQDLIKLIKEKADLRAIKKKLEDISKIQVDISYTDIESSRKVEAILKANQLEKWKKIQDDYRQKIQSELNKEQTEKK